MSKILGNPLSSDMQTKAEFESDQKNLEAETEQYLGSSDEDSQKQGLEKLGELVSREMEKKARPFKKEESASEGTKDASASVKEAENVLNTGSKLLSDTPKASASKTGVKDAAIGAGVLAGGTAAVGMALKAKHSKSLSDKPAKEASASLSSGSPVTDHETKMRQLEASGISDTADYVSSKSKSDDLEFT